MGTIIPTWYLVQRLVDGGDHFVLLDLPNLSPFSVYSRPVHGSFLVL